MSILASIGAGLASSLGGKALGGLFGGDKPVPPELNSIGIRSSTQGSNTPPPNIPANSSQAGTQAPEPSFVDEMLKSATDATKSGLSSVITDKITGGAGKQGRNARDYLNNAFPELNPWEKAGAGASGVGADMSGQQNAYNMKRMELDTAYKMKQMDNDTALKIAGVQSDTAMRNVDEQLKPVYAKLGPEINKITAEVSKINADASLSSAQKDVANAKVYESYAAANNLDAQSVKAAAETELAGARTYNERNARSIPGKIKEDIKSESQQLAEKVKSGTPAEGIHSVSSVNTNVQTNPKSQGLVGDTTKPSKGGGTMWDHQYKNDRASKPYF